MSLPVTVVNASDRNPFLKAVDLIGWLMWAVGFMVEATADQQKLTFKKSTENRGKWCNVGLWKYTRHPNYFGEVCLLLLSNQSVFKLVQQLTALFCDFIVLLIRFLKLM